ncbi:TolC family outer membrane protein [Sediminicoccus sp. KRV36]|uniref:TolC family outer membrane protein n=1 Tax=Sediminicoccus sp. KRV36 TaxID=3133721 RepID=UPI00200CC560|nr:TolC family outer membrane protein [Sediminicoccus rosea]UPY39218.1 TolC family outer membrane protein [Sediminicoccus rosea]
MHLGMKAALLTAVATMAWSAGPARSQTLQEALAQAYNNNPTLLAARAQLRGVDEGVPQALAGWRPTVVMAGSYGAADVRTRSQTQQFRADGSFFWRDPAFPQSTTIRQERTPATASVTLTQPIYRGGRTTAQTRQAENLVLAQRARLLATEQQVLGDAIAAYIGVIQNGELLRLNINNEQVLARQLQATNERFRVGEITRTDVAQAESRLAGARTSRTQADGNLQIARATFERVVGEAPRRLTNPQPLQAAVRSGAEAQATAASNNPNVVAALFNAAAARDNIDVQASALMPQVSGNAQAFRNDNNLAPHTRQNGGQVTLNLSAPLYQGGAEYASIRQARQTAQQNLSQVDEARRAAAQAAAQSWETLVSARAAVTSVRVQIRAQEIALDGVQREAIVGSRTTLDVLNAEQELLNARTNLVNALAAVVTGSYSLAGSIGRLTAQDLGLAVEIYDATAYYQAVRNRWAGMGDYSSVATRR